ncbi:hypothetical protein SOVF_129240 [Spinacia oleracea]|nr:hypothetical protein SOVF_129240 [Spinacia oleracea]
MMELVAEKHVQIVISVENVCLFVCSVLFFFVCFDYELTENLH